jgi:hypothetical protein
MKWLIFSAPLDGVGDDVLWYMRPFYNDRARPRKPEYAELKLPDIPEGQESITVGDITVTLGGATVNGITIYSQSDQERIDQWIQRAIADSNIPLTNTTPVHLVEHTDLPSDRYFRNAWEWSD